MTGGRVGGKSLYTRVDENNNESSTGNYILFGSYPKTIKADGITINENDIDDYGYYLGSDGARYGTTIVSGTEYYFKVEPIKWQILSESNGEAILLAEDILTANVPFYISTDMNSRTINGTTVEPNNYEYSSIRAWLNSYNGSDYNVENYSSFTTGDYQNNGFYNQAFSKSEMSMIFSTEVDNSAATTDKS